MPTIRWTGLTCVLILMLQAPGVGAQTVELPLAVDLQARQEIEERLDLAWDYAHGGDVPRALEELLSWERNQPTIPDYPFTRGVLLYEANRYSDALSAFSRAIELQARGDAGLWTRLYAADILLSQHLTARARILLDEALRFEGSPRSLLFAASLRQRIRIREEELTEVNQIGGITYYLPPWLIPAADRPAFYRQVERQWDAALEFLGLDPDTPAPTIYLYPSERLYRKFFPVDADLAAEAYRYREVHLIFPSDHDVLPMLAPYALDVLQRQLRRTGRPYPLVPAALDDAIRGSTTDQLGLGAYCRALKDAGLLPPVESLLDSRNLSRIPPEVGEPMMGLFLRLLKERFRQPEFQQALAHPGFLASLPRGLASYQPDFDAWLTASADLLEDPAGLAAAVNRVPPFAALPIVDPSLQGDLLQATQLYDSGQAAEGRALVERILAREPRYGEARYLLARDLMDRHQFNPAIEAFEQVLRDVAPQSAALPFSHFSLGRLRKLRSEYPLALLHYQAAIAAGLPEPAREEAQLFAAAIEAWLDLAPDPTAAPGDHPAPFLLAFDQALNFGEGFHTPGVISPEADPGRLATLAAWYHDPAQLRFGTGWQHRLVQFSQRHPGVMAVEVEVLRVDELGKVARGWKPERRRFLILNAPGGAQFLDYADEAAIIRPRGRLAGMEG